MYIKEDHTYNIRNDLKLTCNDVENIWIETNVNGKLCGFAAIYRHPRHNISAFQAELIDKLNILENTNTPYYLSGDININLLKCSTNSGIKFTLMI